MSTAWDRIEAWLKTHAPEIAAGLNPPATAEELAAAERLLNVRIPDDVRAVYLRHDGQSSESPRMFDGWEWLSLARIRDEWEVWKGLLDGGDFAGIESDADGTEVRVDWWNPGWIPLTYSGAGDHHCLDMAPGPGGRTGQIIEMWHDEGSRPVVAPSFDAWLSEFADSLEADEFVLSKEYGVLCRREDL